MHTYGCELHNTCDPGVADPRLNHLFAVGIDNGLTLHIGVLCVIMEHPGAPSCD